MKKHLHLFLWLVLLLFVMVSGCSLFAGTESEKSDDSVDKNGSLSAEEILQKAEASMTDTSGVRYDIVGDQSLVIEKDGKNKAATMDFNAALQLDQKPFAIHLKGNINTDTDTVPVELYLAQGIWYSRMDEGDWTRSTIPSFGNGQGQNLLPAESLQQFRRMIEESNDSSRVHFSNEEDAYVLELNVTEEGLKKEWGDDYKNLKKKLEPSWEEIGLTARQAEARIVQFNRRFSIDKETFIPKQIDHATIWEIPLEKGSITLEQNMVITYAGESTRSITIPAEVTRSSQDK
ncbi:DUF6612 family protein [Desmospora activa]|uniref:Outer membrane lipoprotein-sorting protein n=1 Tax=Desmospora activa DSM 45169 TaxID=1121389 RepID=A0A2T4Z6S8_9BACL|nr:DUF6612 family protein [Desmospora activa]PTM57587.1 hypothetical protein C8J48_0136 [Desmospora activa DSM 45169]